MWYVLSLSLSALAIDCPSYTCGASPTTSTTCQSSTTPGTQIQYTVTPCTYGLMCPYSIDTSNCQASATASRYPGEYCFVPADCISNVCTGSVCQGANVGGACNGTQDCEPGYYCKASVCTTQVAINGACVTDSDCTNDAICDLSFCILMFSKIIGNTTSWISPEGLAAGCSTGYANVTAGKTVCAVAPISVNNGTIRSCTTNADCGDTLGFATKNCTCGFGGRSYCPLFEGDDIVTEMISDVELLFTSSKNNCNGLSRFSYACFYAIGSSSLTNWYNYALKAQQYYNNTFFSGVNAPSCVQNTYLASTQNIQIDQSLSNLGYSFCPQYTCNALPTNQCVAYEKDIVYDTVRPWYQVSSCPSGSYCNTGASGSNANCSPNTPVLGNPGDYCNTTANYNCEAGLTCTNNVCQGVVENGNCTVNSCNPGLYCNTSNLCAPVNNSAPCTDDSMCSTFYTCLNTVCTKVYSLANGAATVITSGGASGHSISCTSGFAYSTGSGTAYCATAPTSNYTSANNTCFSGGVCWDKTSTYQKPCTCGYDGNGYCPYFEGDGNYLANAIANYQKLATMGVSCFSKTRITSLCVMGVPEKLQTWYWYYTNITQYLSGPTLMNNAACIKSVYTASYWEALNYVIPSNGSNPHPHHSGAYYLAVLVSVLAALV